MALSSGCGPSQGSATTTTPPTSSTTQATTTEPSTVTTPTTTTTITPTTTTPATPRLPSPQTEIGVFALDLMVWSAEVLPDGSVLIGTETGLVEWDPETGATARRTMLDGLPFNDVRSIAASGADLWLTSGWNTAARYDGTEWTVFDETDGLPGPWPYSVEIAPGGTVWVGDYGNGLARYNGSSWTTITRGLPSLEVLDLEIAADGVVWVGTWGGLSRFSPDGTIEVVYMGEAVYDVAIAPDGDVWFDTWNPAIQRHSVARVSPGDPHLGPPGWSMRHPVVTPDGEVWAAVTSTGDVPPGPGYARYVGGEEWVLHAGDDQPDPGTVTMLEAMPDGSILAGTTRGAFWYHDERWTRIDLGVPAGISAHWIEADGNDLWIGSDDELVLMRDGKWHSYPYPAVPDEGTGPIGVADGRGGAWIGTIRGLAHFDGSRWTEVLYDHAGNPWTDYGIDADEIGFVLDWRLAVTPDGTLWVTPAARAEGLWRYAAGSWAKLDQPAVVFDLAVAGNGTLYALTDLDGDVMRWSGGGWVRLPEIPFPTWDLTADWSRALVLTEHGIHASSGERWQNLGLTGIWQASPLPDGSMWASSQALFRYDGSRWIPTVVGNSPSSVYLVDAAQTDDGATWLVTGMFLYRYPPGWHWPAG